MKHIARQHVPGLGSGTPSTTLVTLRFQDPVNVSEAKPQPMTADWTRAEGYPAVTPSPTTKTAVSPSVKGNVL